MLGSCGTSDFSDMVLSDAAVSGEPIPRTVFQQPEPFAPQNKLLRRSAVHVGQVNRHATRELRLPLLMGIKGRRQRIHIHQAHR